MTDVSPLSDLQLAIMRILWDREEATAAEVHAELAPSRTLAPTTVATLLSRLEKRGALAYRKQGRQYVYRAVLSEKAVRGSMLQRVTDLFFRGDEGALVSHLVSAADVAPSEREPSELDAVAQLIRARESIDRDDG